MAEQRGHRPVAAQRGAVDLDEASPSTWRRAFFSSKMRRASWDLPAPVGPVSRMGARDADGDLLDALDERVERRVPRLDARP